MWALCVIIVLLVSAIWYLAVMPGPRHRGPISGVTTEETALASRLRSHVERLATSIGPRTADDVHAQRAALDYIHQELKRAGWNVRHQPICDAGLPNLVVELPGAGAAVVVGAHYDTVTASPGADDNASGVAVLLELARLMAGRSFARPVHLVAFSEEERGLLGSRFYASDLQGRGQAVKAMLSLEMLGYYTDQPQRYPLNALSWLYPERGDFIAFVGNLRSAPLVRTCVGTMRRAVAFPCEGMAAPEALNDIRRSDHAPFWDLGHPAVMVTDTSNFRNPNYHGPYDTADTLDYARMSRLTRGLLAVIERLAAMQ